VPETGASLRAGSAEDPASLAGFGGATSLTHPLSAGHSPVRDRFWYRAWF